MTDTYYSAPLQGNNRYAQAGARLSVDQQLSSAKPEPAAVWQHGLLLLPWLDQLHKLCLKPSAQVLKPCEWLLDNEFQLRRAVRQLHQDLPVAYYQRLPRLSGAHYQGIPRVLAMARGMLSVSQGQVCLSTAVAFVNGYQEAQPVSSAAIVGELAIPELTTAELTIADLTIAELWAFPAMLRLACLEMLLQSFAELFPSLTLPFALPITQPMRLPIADAPGSSLTATARISQAITALVNIATLNWSDFFEQVSRVEACLQQDPADVYRLMDADSRDSYRRAVERIAEHTRMTEHQVAEMAVALARPYVGVRRLGHVGAWLVGEGRPKLEQQLGFRPPWQLKVRRSLQVRAGLCYGTAMFIFTVLALAVPASLLGLVGASVLQGILIMLLSLAPALLISVTLTHGIATRLVAPRPLPKMAVESGLSAGWDTALVMPVILRQQSEVAPLLARLERHWLTNPDPLIKAALLSDLADAPSQCQPQDEQIEAALVAGIRRLNDRYSSHAPFVLLHRRRTWNPAQGRWMGWERKRGKLEALVALILEQQSLSKNAVQQATSHPEQDNQAPPRQSTEPFELCEGDLAGFCQARFVVTMDADTQAQPDGINRLIAILAHPLNRVEFCPKTGRPIRGYTFIQPRVEIAPDAECRSLFSRLYAGDTALDIYSRAVSDVYQDVFGEAIFTGKGAFDVAAFEQCLKDRVPENTILSHDLFEGLHGRVALASDIVFYEDFPENYLSYTRRALRWIRGDWQLTPWLGASVPSRGQPPLASRFSMLDRWKLLDNLRRSLLAPMLVGLASLGWLLLPLVWPWQAWLWSLLAVGALAGALIIDVLSQACKHGLTRELSLLWTPAKDRVRLSYWQPLASQAGRTLLAIIFLAYDAAVATKAIVCALWRLYISGKNLLEWTSAAHSGAEVPQTWQGTWREMAAAPLLAVLLSLLIASVNPGALSGAAPLLLLWFISPHIAWWISREPVIISETLTDADRQYLRGIARRTWLYFETFAGPDNNWLPCDNYQAAPYQELAHRSSPTNVGMLMLAALTAWDLGHIERRDLAARMAAALDTLDKLDSHDGHIYNWFDTQTLASLAPRYISTVDSGNLAVCLLTLSAGCREAASAPLINPASWDGLSDSLQLLKQTIDALAAPRLKDITRPLANIIASLPSLCRQPQDWYSALTRLNTEQWPQFKSLLNQGLAPDLTSPTLTSSTQKPRQGAPTQGEDSHLAELYLWLNRCDHHLMSLCRDLDALAPWLVLQAAAPLERVGIPALLAALPQPNEPWETLDARLAQARRLLGPLVAGAPANATPNQTTDNLYLQWLAKMVDALEQGAKAGNTLHHQLLQIAERAERRAFAMNFAPLYDPNTETFFIGHNLDTGHLDANHYDLLASEARLASYFAIAKRDVPLKHWFHLGRPLSQTAEGVSLLSWNGSMFEYLMPALLLPSVAGRLLGESERAAVSEQRRYAARLQLPWGVSESGFAARNDAQHYQYQAFGVPGLGIKQGLAKDYVVAPYASALALSVAPVAATENLRRLDKLGLRDRYGFFESADFTPERLTLTDSFTPVRSYMAHHQGMISAAINNALNDHILVERCMREPRMAASSLLLQERIPLAASSDVAQPTQENTADLTRTPTPVLYGWRATQDDAPQLHMLGNGNLSAWITDAGDGALWWRDQAVTAWGGDAMNRQGEAKLYICQRAHDAASHTNTVTNAANNTDNVTDTELNSSASTDSVWCLGKGVDNVDTDIEYFAEKMLFHESRHGLASHLEVSVAANEDVECRRLTLFNEGEHALTLIISSYAQVVLAPRAAYERHPAFSKLFVHSEYLAELHSILFTRNALSPEHTPPVALHRLIGAESTATLGFETDRARFVGRHGNLERPLGATQLVQGESGWTLDPVMSLQAQVTLAPGARLRLDFVTVVGKSREQVLNLAERLTSHGDLDWLLEDTKRSQALAAHRLTLDTPPWLMPKRSVLSWCLRRNYSPHSGLGIRLTRY